VAVAEALQQEVVGSSLESSGLSDQLDSREQPGLFDAYAWRDAALAWFLQRIALLALTYLLSRRPMPLSTSALLPSWNGWLHIWSTWDGSFYATIAASGYTQLVQAAFFPLYPLLERLLAALMGGNTALAGVLIANLSCLAAFALLRILVERTHGRTVSRRALLYLAIFPLSFFLAAAYAESLFLLLSLATFLALSERHWTLAGILAALSTLTRPVGILLLVPIIYEATIAPRLAKNRARLEDPRLGADGCEREWPSWRDIAVTILLPIVALVGFNLILAPRFGTLTSTTSAEVVGWGRRLSWPGDGVGRTVQALIQGPVGAPLSVGTEFLWRVIVALDIFWTVLLAVLALASLWRWKSVRPLPLSYGLYAVTTAVLVLATPMDKPGFDWAALASNGRFLLVVFPSYLVAAVWGEKHIWLHRLIVGVSLVLFLLLATAFITGSFVA
jgi:hypothetical protein